MSLLARCKSIAGGLFRRASLEREMDAELRLHIAAYIEDQMHAGVPQGEAERLARIEFAPIERFKEECREARGLRLLDELRQDIRYAFRVLRKSPGFVIVASLTLAVGIGVNTSIFSVVNTFVLNPLPYPNAGKLVTVWSTSAKQGRLSPVSPADLDDWRKPNEVFNGLAGWYKTSFTLAGASDPERIDGARVNADFFRLLGVAPAIGRDFAAQDDEPGSAGVALISDGLWRAHFGGTPTALGKVVELDGQPFTIIGVMPPAAQLLLMGRSEIWAPLALNAAALKNRGRRSLRVIARVKAAAGIDRARAFLTASARQLEQDYPNTNANRGICVRTLREEIASQTGRDETLMLFGIVGCLLLISGVNVANLMFGRGAERQKEMSVRLAIGAGRFRLVRQLLTENAILFLLGGALSVLLAKYEVHWLSNAIPSEIRQYLPNSGIFQLDLPVLLYTLAVAAIAGLVFGLAPALNCSRGMAGPGLKEAGSRMSAGRSSTRLKSCLAVFELSLALIVLTASGLQIKSMIRIYSVSPGFQPKDLVTAKIALPSSKYATGARALAFFDDVLQRIRLLPSVQSAGAGEYIPFGNTNSSSSYTIEGQPAPRPGEVPTADITAVTSGYLSTLGVGLLSGRFFSDIDRADSPRVVIINKAMAQRHWPGEDALGRQIRVGNYKSNPLTIVGVVQDVKLLSLKQPAEPQVYVPARQSPALSMGLVIRTSGDLAQISTFIRSAVSAVDKSQPVFDIQTMEKRIAVEHSDSVIVAQTTGAFAMIGLFLAAIGIYGVMAYSVSTRRQEIGVRMALGARAGDVLSLVLRQGLRLTVLGLAFGLAGSFLVTRFLAAILFQVSPRDLATFTGVSVLLAAVAMLACYVPARRASSVDPVVVLRNE